MTAITYLKVDEKNTLYVIVSRPIGLGAERFALDLHLLCKSLGEIESVEIAKKSAGQKDGARVTVHTTIEEQYTFAVFTTDDKLMFVPNGGDWDENASSSSLDLAKEE